MKRVYGPGVPAHVVIGIDPGLSGALAVLDLDSGAVLAIENPPTLKIKKGKHGKRNVYMEQEMSELLRNWKAKYRIIVVGIEQSIPMPKQSSQSTASTFFGFGLWVGMLTALQLPYTKFRSMDWKRAMNIVAGSDKSASIARAQQLFPQADLLRTARSKVEHDGRAEALLIAEYTRRVQLGKI